jgi:hypothetical protein
MSLAGNWIALLLVLGTVFTCRSFAATAIELRTNDIVAFVGGSDVAAAQFTGHLETLLAVKFAGTRFRNFGWEGDTVFAQRRDVGFPPLAEHLKRAGVTVVFLEFGRAEALDSRNSVSNFVAAYEKFIGEISKQTLRIVIVTPPPFETGSGLLPDLSSNNPRLVAFEESLHALAQQRDFPLIDLFGAFGGAKHREPRLTEDGFQLTSRGHALLAAAFAQQMKMGSISGRAGAVDPQGVWSNQDFEKLRQTVIEKNKLWFNYWRPQNWAFLGGDRTTQPSSRDHRDPKVRWFPAEMEKYVPLIAAKEAEMTQAAEMIRGGVR